MLKSLLHYCYLFLLSIIFASFLVPCFAGNHAKRIFYADDLEFIPNMDKLLNQETEYAIKIFEGSDFLDTDFSNVNIFGESYPSDAIIIASKMAFIVSGVTSDFFNEDLFIGKNFLQKTMKDAEIYPIDNSYNFDIVKTTKGYMGKKVVVEGVISHYLYPDAKKAEKISLSQFNDLMTFDPTFGKPHRTALTFFYDCSKYVYHTYSVYKFFPTPDKKSTMILHYQAVSMSTKDLWFAPKSFLKKEFKSQVSEGLEFTVDGFREYRQQH